MPRKTLECPIIFMTGISAAVLVICGFAVTRPNFHGSNFVVGKCFLRKMSDISSPRYQSCDCSNSNSEDDDETCWSRYPCVNAYGVFHAYIGNMSETAGGLGVYGTFYKDFSALDKGCLIVPYCSRNQYSNEAAVRDYWSMVGRTYYRKEFECWGHGNQFYFDHNYSMLKGYLALFIPLGFFIVSFTSGAIFLDIYCFKFPFLPFICIFGYLCKIFGGLYNDGIESSESSSCRISPSSNLPPVAGRMAPPQGAMESNSDYISSGPPTYTTATFGSNQNYQTLPPAGYSTNNDAPPSYETVVNDNYLEE